MATSGLILATWFAIRSSLNNLSSSSPSMNSPLPATLSQMKTSAGSTMSATISRALGISSAIAALKDI